MKGVPEQPMCGFSRDVVRMLNAAGKLFFSCSFIESSSHMRENFIYSFFFLGADYVAYNVLDSPELREGIKKFRYSPPSPSSSSSSFLIHFFFFFFSYSNWPTIPQLFVGGEFIGGRGIT